MKDVSSSYYATDSKSWLSLSVFLEVYRLSLEACPFSLRPLVLFRPVFFAGRRQQDLLNVCHPRHTNCHWRSNHVYPLPDSSASKAEVLRTKYTPYSAVPCNWISENSTPVFTSPPYRNLYNLDLWTMGKDVPRGKYSNKIQTYREKEFIWLEAFLRACAYMQELPLNERCRDTVHGTWG